MPAQPYPTIPEEFLILARHAITSARRDAESETLRQLGLAALRAWPAAPAPSNAPMTREETHED